MAFAINPFPGCASRPFALLLDTVGVKSTGRTVERGFHPAGMTAIRHNGWHPSER